MIRRDCIWNEYFVQVLFGVLYFVSFMGWLIFFL